MLDGIAHLSHELPIGAVSARCPAASHESVPGSPLPAVADAAYQRPGRQREEQMNRSILSGLSILALVAGAALSAEPEHGYDGVYTGKRSLTKGTASAECPAEDDVSVTIRGETLTFTNSTLKNYTMPFEPEPDGSFGQTHTDESGAIVHYHGQIKGSIMEADVQNYVTDPPCEYHWRLQKQ